MNKNRNSLFDWKHTRLWRFSMWASVLSKIILLVYGFLVLYQVYNYNSFAHNQYQTNLLGLFSRNWVSVLDVVAQLAGTLIQGLVYYLVLEGVSLGLSMIVETDINYRDNQPAEVG